MANWASTSYTIEGPKETLKKIYNAIQHPDTSEGDDGWEGGVLKALEIKWKERQPDGSGYYTRGFIQDPECIEFNPEINDILSFHAEEAWGLTDFHEVLKVNFPDVKVYWIVEESGEEIYATNDKEGKYFSYRWNVEACINGNYLYEDFTTEKAMYEWLSDNTEDKVADAESAEKFNNDHEELGTEDDNYINIHEFQICE